MGFDIVVLRVIFLIYTSSYNIIFIYINIVSRYGISKYIIYRFIYIDEVFPYISLSLALYSKIIYSLVLIIFLKLAIDITIIILISQRYN